MTLPPSRAGYQVVADDLRDKIIRRVYEPGAALPTETDLMEQYGTTRNMINRGVQVLVSQGYVRVERGRGTVVCETREIHRNTAARYSREARERAGGRGAFDTEIRTLNMQPRSDTTVTTIPAPADVAIALNIDPGTPVICRRREMYADDRPVQLAPSYIPADIDDGRLALLDSGPGGIISRMAELGYAPVRWTESVRTRPPTREEAKFLGVDERTQVLEMSRVHWTAAGRAVELCVHTVPRNWVLEYSGTFD